MSDDEALRFLSALIRHLGDDDYTFTVRDPSGHEPWQVYYVVHGGTPYTLAIRISGDGKDKRVEAGLLERGSLDLREVTRILARQAPN